MVRRRTKIAVAAVVVSGGVAYALLPRLAERGVRDELARQGFPDARFEIASIGLDHLDLRNVHLVDGIDVGRLSIDRGVSLLWRDIDEVLVRNASVSLPRAARVGAAAHRGAVGKVPFRRARISDSKVDLDGRSAAVAGTVAATPRGFDVTVTVRDPSAHGWAAQGRGRVVLDPEPRLEDSHVDITLPRGTFGNASFENATVAADIAGSLSSWQLRGSGLARLARVGVGPVEVTDVALPITFDSTGVRVSGGQASAMGGRLAIDASIPELSRAGFVVEARGLRLADALQPTHRLSGTGLIDGRLEVRSGPAGWELSAGELHARAVGTIQVTDQQWRDRVAEASAPLAVHAAIADALLDFEYSNLTADLAPAQWRLVLQGRGRRNHQALDIAIGVHDLRGVP